MNTSEDSNERLGFFHTCTPRAHFASEVLTNMAGSKRLHSEEESEEEGTEDAVPRKRGATSVDLSGEDENNNNTPSMTYEEALGRGKQPKKAKEPWFRNPGQLFAPNHKGVTTYVGDLLVSTHAAAVVCGRNSFFIVDGGGADEEVEVKIVPRRPFTLEGDLTTVEPSSPDWARFKGRHKALIVTRDRPIGAPDRSLQVRVNVTSPSWPSSVPITLTLHYHASDTPSGGDASSSENGQERGEHRAPSTGGNSKQKRASPGRTLAARPSSSKKSAFAAASSSSSSSTSLSKNPVRPPPAADTRTTSVAASSSTSSGKSAQPAPAADSSSSSSSSSFSSTSSSKKPAEAPAPATPAAASTKPTPQAEQAKPTPQAEQAKPRRTRKSLASSLLDVEAQMTRRMDRLRQKAEIARKRYDQAKELLRGIDSMREIFGSSDSETE